MFQSYVPILVIVGVQDTGAVRAEDGNALT